MIASESQVCGSRNRFEWVPTSFFLVHGPRVSTTLRFPPLHLTRQDTFPYFSRVRIFGEDPLEPVWTGEYGPLSLFDISEVTSSEVAQALGTDTLFHYGEALNYVEDFPPPDSNTALPSFMHFRSTDGSFQGHLASFTIFGSPRKMLKGDFYYENFPCARIDPGVKLQVYLTNPFVRPSRAWVILVDADGRSFSSDPIEMPGKSVRLWTSDALDLRGGRNPFGVIVKADLKVNSAFGAITAQGRMISFDHGHPFLADVLDHTEEARSLCTVADEAFYEPIVFAPFGADLERLRPEGLDLDGWAAGRMRLAVPKGAKIKGLRLRLCATLPSLEGTAVVLRTSGNAPEELTLSRKPLDCEVAVNATADAVMLEFAAARQSALSMQDPRERSYRVERIDFVR